MRCDQCHRQFTDLHESALNSADQQEIQDHLAACSECRAEYAAFLGTVTALRDLPLITPPAHLLGDIGHRIDDEQAAAVPPLRRFLRMAPVLAAAACLVLVVTGVVTLNKYRTGEAFDLRPPQTIAGRATVDATAPAEALSVDEIAKQPGVASKQADTPQPSSPVAQAEPLGMTVRRPRPHRLPAPRAARPTRVVPPMPPATHIGPSESDGRAAKAVSAGHDGEIAEVPAISADAMAEAATTSDSAVEMSIGSRGAETYAPSRALMQRPSDFAGAATRALRNDASPQKFLVTTKSGESCALQTIPAFLNIGPEAERLYVHFTPPEVRLVGQPVTCTLDVTSDEDLEDVGVRIETRDNLALTGDSDGYIYRGALEAGRPENMEFKIVANQTGTQRMRASVETPVQGLRGQMEIVLPGFEAQPLVPAPDPLGKAINVSFYETPVRQALMRVARDGGLSLLIGASVGGERTRYSAIDTPAGSVLRIIAESHGYRVELRDGTYHVCAKE